jgi:hypothetical protein
VDEARRIDLWTLGEYRRQLVDEGASVEEWSRYRTWRDRVLGAADASAAA